MKKMCHKYVLCILNAREEEIKQEVLLFTIGKVELLIQA